MLPQLLRVVQLPGEDSLFLVLVRIERGDALPGGAVLFVGQASFLQRVQLPVPGQKQRGPVTDFQVFRADRHAFFPQGFDLDPEVFGVQRDTVAQNIHNAGVKNAGGQQMQRKLPIVVDDGVARVAASLIADDHVKVLRQQIDHAALALVAPVDAHDRTGFHVKSSLIRIQQLPAART